ncbi:MAG: phage holin family protein [Parcubacteria group bacterium]|nr:phage holin family protein [Parcubacteria group bacterium]
MIIGFLFRIIANALAILAAAWLVPNIVFNYEFIALLKLALILALVNTFLKPVLKLIFSPLILITLGLFTFVINIFLLWLVVYFTPELSISGFYAYFLTTLILSAFNFIVSAATNKRD